MGKKLSNEGNHENGERVQIQMIRKKKQQDRFRVLSKMQSALSCYRELEIAASRAFESRSNFFSIKILFKLFENFI